MKVNKVTTLRPEANAALVDSDIQAHFDDQNEDGWYLIALDNLVGWYRFFWEKEVE